MKNAPGKAHEHCSPESGDLLERINSAGQWDRTKAAGRRALPRNVIAIAGVAVLLMLAGYVVGQNKNSATADAIAGPTASSSTLAATTNEGEGTANTPLSESAGKGLETSGYVVARNKASVSSDITGRVRSIHVVIGQRIARGDVIAELDDREARIRMEAAQLAIAQFRLAGKRAVIELSLETERAKKMEGLLGQKYVSTSSYDDVVATRDTAGIQAEIANVNLADAENTFRAAQIFVERHVIRAPFDGVVVEVSARPGETVSPTSGGNSFIRTGIVQLVDPVSLYVVAEVPERQLASVLVGQPVRIAGKAAQGPVFVSRVAWVAPVSNRQRGIVEVGIDLVDPALQFIDGMEVSVRFEVSKDAAAERNERNG